MKDAAKVLAVAVLFVAVIAGGVALSWAHWTECRRLHPWWYCLEQK